MIRLRPEPIADRHQKRTVGELSCFLHLINEADEWRAATFCSEEYRADIHGSLDDLHACACRAALAMFQQGESPSFFVAVARPPIPEFEHRYYGLFISTRWRGDEEKIAVCHALRSLFVKSHVVRYAVAQEAWAASYGPNDVSARDVPPRERSDRDDILMVAAVDVSGAEKQVRERTWLVDPGEADVRAPSIIRERDGADEVIMKSGRLLEMADAKPAGGAA